MFGKKSTSKQPSKVLALGQLPDAPAGMFSDPRDEFAEIYGRATVGHNRMFVVAVLVVLLGLVAVVGLIVAVQNSTVVPVLVQFNDETGVVNKPIRIDTIRPTQAVMKAEIGRWLTKVFTIDNAQTGTFMREANVMTKGLGTQQFMDFRAKQNVFDRLAKDPTLQRTVEKVTVDISQEGVAFGFLNTHEAKGNDANAGNAKFRVTLKYEFIPPKTDDEVMANPLGLYITSMNVIEEGSQK